MRMQVIKGSGNNYTLYSNGETYIANARGKLKQTKVLVGDYVDAHYVNNQFVIENVHKRTNQLIRPVVSNIDQMCLMIAPNPKPDLLVIDKQLLHCERLNIKPFICINKSDIADTKFVNEVKKIYNFLPIVTISAKYGEGIQELLMLLKGKLTALSGQSAVGKSSLINCLSQKKQIKTNTLCAKTDRGQHTTKHSEIHIISEDILIIDTPGFSSLEINDIKQSEVAYLMPDFLQHSEKCKFQPCTHVSEKINDCAVKQALANNHISESRYNNYVQIYNSIKPEWERRRFDARNSNFSINTPRKKQTK